MTEFAFEKENNFSDKQKEIELIKRELRYFRGKRLLFLMLGLSFLTLSFIFLIIGIVSDDPATLAFMIFLVVFLFTASITMFILRSALYNTRIRNRRIRLIQLSK